MIGASTPSSTPSTAAQQVARGDVRRGVVAHQFSLLAGLSRNRSGHASVPAARDPAAFTTRPRRSPAAAMQRHVLSMLHRFWARAGSSNRGLPRVVDAKAQGAKLANERRFYYANALAEIDYHVKASAQRCSFYSDHGRPRPLRLRLQPRGGRRRRRAGHAPRDERVPAAPCHGAHGLCHLRAELVRRFPGRPFLIVLRRSPPTAAVPAGVRRERVDRDIVASGNDAARMTYYTLDAVLSAAALAQPGHARCGVPRHHAARGCRRSAFDSIGAGAMLLCKGRYHDCPAREEVLRFHRRLIDSGLMKAL